MEEFDWIEKSDKDKKEKGDEFATEAQKVKEDEEGTRADKIFEEETVCELEGEPFDPFKNFAVLALVDIAPEVKKLRKVPQFFHIKRSVTKIGIGGKAHIKLNDLKTVKLEHGAINFKEGHFFIHPQEGMVKVNGERVPKEGSILKNGLQIEMGSARFIFLAVIDKQDPTPP